MNEYQQWKHVFKLDPNKEISDESLEAICESGTDAIIVGGTDGVTLDNVLSLLVRIRRYAVDCALEVSNIESLTGGFDYYFIPTVLNSTEVSWVTGLHHEAMKEHGAIIDWEQVVMEGYCVLNPHCKVAEATKANTDLTSDDVVAYARMADKMFRLPFFYLEYSGTYGEVNVVKEVASVLEEAKLIYGGGIRTADEARQMAQYADVVVVGNLIYEDEAAALATVKAVKEA